MKPEPAEEIRAAPLLPMRSRAVVVLTGVSYLCVGLGFSYLDRRYGSLGVEGFLWLVWTLLGFGAGVLNVAKPMTSGRVQWALLGWFGLVLAVFPGIAMFSMLRWVALTLLIVMGARAAVLKTRRDFYLTLTVIFAVSFIVGTHANSDWTLWFYLGPAWVSGGLALSWEHALGAPISRWAKLSMALGFISFSVLLAAVLFLFAPRPAILGFGFLPPGTSTPGLFRQPAAQSESRQGRGNSGPTRSGADSGPPGMGASGDGELAQKWGNMLGGMRATLKDRSIPQWQRGILEQLVNAAQSLVDVLMGKSPEPDEQSAAGLTPKEQDERLNFKVNWLLVLALSLAAYLLWRRRYRLGMTVALGCSWLLAAHFPAQSMRLSARALKWCLHNHGHRRNPGQSVREHWVTVASVAPLAKRWLGYAVEIYCATRFGGVPASRRNALNMRVAVQGASDIMMGLVPELNN